MGPLVIYHAGCIDGQGAATAFYHKYRDAELFPGVYSETPPEIAGRDVYLVDFSYPLHVLKEMLTRARHVTIIDHHKTAIETLQDFEHPRLTKFLNNNHSGAVLTWKFCYLKTAVPAMLLHIEDRDLWRFKYDFTRPITAYLYSLDFDVSKWCILLDESRWIANTGVMVAAGEALMRSDAKRVQQLISNARIVNVAGHSVYAVNANGFHASDLGHELAKGMPFAMSYYEDSDGNWICSLRSDENGVDVSEIAQKFGGGGHKHASGFKVKRPKLSELLPS